MMQEIKTVTDIDVNKISNIDVIKTKLPRKKKKAFIKKYGRDEYHKTYKNCVEFSLVVYKSGKEIQDLYDNGIMSVSCEGLGSLDEDNNFNSFGLKSVNYGLQ